MLFDQSVDNLPQNLKHISFGYFFNKPVDNLPKSIKYACFGWVFNYNIDKLPDTIETLIINNKYYSHQIRKKLDQMKNLKKFYINKDGFSNLENII